MPITVQSSHLPKPPVSLTPVEGTDKFRLTQNTAMLYLTREELLLISVAIAELGIARPSAE